MMTVPQSNLTGRVAVVTGAGSGIGQAVALALAEAGAAVLAADRNGEAAAATAASLRARGATAAAQVVDVADPEAVQSMIEAAVTGLGGVDILVNNAGFQHVAPLEEFPLEQWNRLLAVLLTGPFLCTRAALPYMKRKGWGRVLNIASIHGKVGAPFKVGYCAAKHGVLGLTRVAALETAADGITVNAICPGFVDTPLVRNQIPALARNMNCSEDEAVERAILSRVPQRRLLEAAEVGRLAVFLASDAAAGITGQALNLDGGTVMF